MPITKDPRQQELIQLNAQRVRDEYAKYTQPDISVGRQVRWSPHADFSYGETVLAWVEKVENNTLNLAPMGVGYTGMSITEVPHVSDPRLMLDIEWKQKGAWDYAEDENDPSIAIDKLKGDVKRANEKLDRQAIAMNQMAAKIEEMTEDLASLQRWADTLGADVLGPEEPPVKPASNKNKS